MGESQLKRLKASLKSHGIIGEKRTGKGNKQNRPRGDRRDREQVLQSIREAFNPFDVQKNRVKHDIIGRRVDGAVGRPGVSKQLGEESRRQALREEISRRNRAGGVIDRRFGENDPSMAPEDKMLERFTRDRQAHSGSKNSLFNLEDSDDEDTVLTHYGQSLTLDQNDDFDADDIDHESDDELNDMRSKRRKLTEQLSTEGEGEEPEEHVKKSKNEIMKEVMEKSKFYKQERQAAKQQDLEVIEDLDDNDNVNDLLNELRGIGSFSGAKLTSDQTETDEKYEASVRELAFERRAQPADRLKTEDEIAREEAEKLHRLEKERVARMLGEVSDEEDNEKTVTRKPAGDDLDYEDESDINDAEEFGFKDFEQQSDSDEDGNVSQESQDDFDFDDLIDDDGSITIQDLEEGQSIPKLVASTSSSSQLEDITGFVFECPSSVEQMANIFAKHSPDQYPVIVDRILKLHHPSLRSGNKEKLSQFTKVLIEYLLLLVDDKTIKITDNVIDQLVSHIIALTSQHTEDVSEYFRELLTQSQTRLSAAISQGHSTSRVSAPSYSFLFTLIGVIFSTSDHFHQIATPASLLMCQHLSQLPISSEKDIAVGLYLCRLLLAYQRVSKRYIPEVILFYFQTLISLLPRSVSLSPSQLRDVFYDEKSLGRFGLDQGSLDDEASTSSNLSFRELVDLNSASIRPQLFSQCLEGISLAVSSWNDKTSLHEIFTPISELLSQISTVLNNEQLAKVNDKISRLLKFAIKERVPLTLQSHRPLPIPTHLPKFEANYNVDKKSYDPDSQRQEIQKLRSAIKKEKKGALREIRRDGEFIAREKIKDKRQKDKEYHEKMARLLNQVNTEEGAEKNKYEREKQARKRRK